MEPLTNEARARIEKHLDEHQGKPPNHLPEVKQIRPWGRADRKTGR